jgi:hypothetical protein
MNNKLHYSFLLCLTIIGSLFLLSFLPGISIGSFDLRKIDLLADIRPETDTTTTTVTDSLYTQIQKVIPGVTDSVVAKQDLIVQEVIEKCKPGLICIEDYSRDSTALKAFLEALYLTKKSDKKLRIAFYGDSFIEGDVFCGSFRDSLQTVFGGRGVGYVPVTSAVTGFRNTIKHRFENWETFSLINKKETQHDIGPAGFTFIPLEGNWIEYRSSKQRYLREFSTIKLFYKSTSDAILHYSIDTLQSSDALGSSGKFEEWTFRAKQAKLVRFEFFPYDNLMIYGASLENEEGICVDNFSIRGNSGLNLGDITRGMYRDFDRLRNYKLIILQFGLNLVVSEKLNYPAYVKRMVTVINGLKESFPNASFLLLSVSDRSENINGEFKTMTSVPTMRDAQRLIAQQSGIAFWDMYEAMGGEGSMTKWTESKPPLGARDYTHLTFRGGRKLAGSLVKSLLYESEKHDKINRQ